MRGSSERICSPDGPSPRGDHIHDPIALLGEAARDRGDLPERQAFVAIGAIGIGEHQRALIGAAKPQRLGTGGRCHRQPMVEGQRPSRQPLDHPVKAPGIVFGPEAEPAPRPGQSKAREVGL